MNKTNGMEWRARPPSSPEAWKSVVLIVVLLAAIALLWDSWLIYPLKLLVVLFHEMSHGLAALLTGGSILRIEMVAQQGGLCITRGGNAVLIFSAGYLGSLLWGGAILTLAQRTNRDRQLVLLLGAILLLTALIWVRPLAGFGFAFAVLTGIGLLAAGTWLGPLWSDLLLKLIGLTSILYAPLDIVSDILARPGAQQSDASLLAERTGIPTLVFGGLWMLLAVAAAIYFLGSNLGVKSSQRSARYE